MHRVHGSALAAAAFMLVCVSTAQGQAGAPPADAARKVADGGISVLGWMGKIDSNEERAGQKLENSKLVKDGEALHVTTGPAVT